MLKCTPERPQLLELMSIPLCGWGNAKLPHKQYSCNHSAKKLGVTREAILLTLVGDPPCDCGHFNLGLVYV